MRKILFSLLAVSLLLACNNSKKSDDKTPGGDTAKLADNTPAPPAVNLLEKMLGSFVGAFGDNKITLLITKAQGDSVEGRSIVGGNDRPFAGVFTEKNGVYNITAKEPGDHPDDGIFNITFNGGTPDSISGTWQPNNTKKPAKQYTLERKKFEYKMDAGDYPEASQRLLKAKDVENMMKEDLQYMRNEIFARHGYCFKKKDLRQQFEMQDWYVPNTVDIKGFLTDIEKKNIDIIKRYEKYAEEYGDEYGR